VKYRPEIDGLRALAIVPVILFHSGFNLISGGYAGVDIFFVISGYLITQILLNDIHAEKFSIINFYERRARRILPALFFILTFTIPFAWLLLPAGELVAYSKSITAVSLFVSNFFFWLDGGYFEVSSDLKLLLHTWSLAVEEQFYIFFPIFLIFLWRSGQKFILPVIFITALISLVLAQIATQSYPIASFFLLPSRAWELAIGALVAIALFNKGASDENAFPYVGPKSNELLSALGFVLIVISLFLLNNQTPHPGFYTLLPTVGAALVILFANSQTLTGAILSKPLFVGVGLISYSAYLWHQPVLVFSRFLHVPANPAYALSLIILIFTLSVLTWKFVEQPFRRKDYISRKCIFTLCLVFTIFLALFGFLSSKVDFDQESKIARELSESKAVYVTDMNERKFVKSRIQIEHMAPDAIVIGSSRVMQINSENAQANILNLAVSGSSLEDDLAIWEMASKRFHPEVVFVGVDPWLFNSKSGQNRWEFLREEYLSAIYKLDHNLISSKSLDHEDNNPESLVASFYKRINFVHFKASDDTPELIDKIRRDGSRVYNISYANKSLKEVEHDVLSFASYAMTPFEYSMENKILFERFILSLRDSHKVILVLSPYHPKLFSYLETHSPHFLRIENDVREFATENNIQVVGSYNPMVAGCTRDEFYDGMHPKPNCIYRILGKL
jgi:peptidoglycan/LPS O-acetylase OafA/YrhL